MKQLRYIFAGLTFSFALAQPAQAQGSIELVNTHPSDNSVFTQGIELEDDGDILVSSGLYNESSIGYLDLETGTYQAVEDLEDQYFAEGLTITPDWVWQLTWQEGVAFKRDPETLEVVDEVSYEGEGWGLAYDEDRQVLWMSDGSNRLYMRDPETFEVKGQWEIEFEGQPLNLLNELEYANGMIYANVWYTNQVYAIDPITGEVLEVYDFTSLLEEADISQADRQTMDSLNGIAHIEDDRFYITGKLYPLVFEVSLR